MDQLLLLYTLLCNENHPDISLLKNPNDVTDSSGSGGSERNKSKSSAKVPVYKKAKQKSVFISSPVDIMEGMGVGVGLGDSMGLGVGGDEHDHSKPPSKSMSLVCAVEDNLSNLNYNITTNEVKLLYSTVLYYTVTVLYIL